MMMSDFEYDKNIQLIVGRTLESVTNEADESVVFVCTDGSAFEAYHMQDCSEWVSVHDIAGDLDDLVGKTITSASAWSSCIWPSDVTITSASAWSSYTWTTQIFRADDGTVVQVRWLGVSNGYYSELVYFGRTQKPIRIDPHE